MKKMNNSSFYIAILLFLQGCLDQGGGEICSFYKYTSTVEGKTTCEISCHKVGDMEWEVLLRDSVCVQTRSFKYKINKQLGVVISVDNSDFLAFPFFGQVSEYVPIIDSPFIGGKSHLMSSDTVTCDGHQSKIYCYYCRISSHAGHFVIISDLLGIYAFIKEDGNLFYCLEGSGQQNNRDIELIGTLNKMLDHLVGDIQQANRKIELPLELPSDVSADK